MAGFRQPTERGTKKGTQKGDSGVLKEKVFWLRVTEDGGNEAERRQKKQTTLFVRNQEQTRTEAEERRGGKKKRNEKVGTVAVTGHVPKPSKGPRTRKETAIPYQATTHVPCHRVGTNIRRRGQVSGFFFLKRKGPNNQRDPLTKEIAQGGGCTR